jgi:hypothetical protein
LLLVCRVKPILIRTCVAHVLHLAFLRRFRSFYT